MSDKTFRLFIDDSGEKEYTGTSRHFVYAGCIVAAEDRDALVDRLRKAKKDTFGTAEVEVKANWILQPRERRRRYFEPFGVTADDLDKFTDEWYEIMRGPELTYAAAVIDKIQMQEKYIVPHNPSPTAYQYLLQRYQKHCAKGGRVGTILVDEMTGATQAKNQWKELLRKHHKHLKEHGDRWTHYPNIADNIEFGPSWRYDLLQVADLVAYNVYRQFRDHYLNWDDPDADKMPVYKALKLLLPRFMRDEESGLVQGWGIVKWPRTTARSRWGLETEEEGG